MEGYQFIPSCPQQPSERTPAMVYPVDQQLSSVYDSEQAIRNGTLFPELNKPMLEHMMPISGASVSAKQAAEFSAWETRLYLDTHPADAQALALYRRYCEAAGTPSYACTFVEGGGQGCAASCCGCAGGASQWSWLDDPWPWEYQGCAGTEGNGYVCL